MKDEVNNVWNAGVFKKLIPRRALEREKKCAELIQDFVLTFDISKENKVILFQIFSFYPPI